MAPAGKGKPFITMIWSGQRFRFEFPRPTLVMGVVNVTPDSFSDGGRFDQTTAAVSHALQLVEEGADLLDIGGESTRPDAEPVPEAEEIDRILPVIEALARQTKVPISVDTMKPAVARAALAAGAAIINDVAANRTDDALWRIVADAGAGYVAMHMRGTPRTMQEAPHYEDVVAEVDAFFADRLDRLAACGVEAERVALDPGIGFGKTLEHNLQLLAQLDALRNRKRPLLVGISRKSFIGRLTGAAVGERLPGSLAGACWAVGPGAAVVRTHDVAATCQALRMTAALLEHR
jgi:dihydropteroate synthase